MKPIWEHILSHIKNKLSLREEFISVKTVLFGHTSVPSVVNLIILVVKQYLVTNKLNQCQAKHVYREGAIEAISNHWRVERRVAMKNKLMDKFQNKWCAMTDSSGELWLR